MEKPTACHKCVVGSVLMWQEEFSSDTLLQCRFSIRQFVGHNLKISHCRHICKFWLTKNISYTICRYVCYLSAYQISLSQIQCSLSYCPLNKTKYFFFFTAPTGILSPDHPARSKLLYQLRLDIQSYNFAYCFAWVWNMVADIEGGM